MSGQMWHKFWGAGFVRTPHNNGVARFVPQLLRITIKFCKSNGSCKGTRQFIEQELIHYARANPSVVVYLKPRRHRSAVVKAEFLNGEMQYLSLHNRPFEEVTKWVHNITTRSGEPVIKLMKRMHTDVPSIQGMWTPWTHMHPDHFQRKYPDAEACAPEKTEKTATDELLEMANREPFAKPQ